MPINYKFTFWFLKKKHDGQWWFKDRLHDNKMVLNTKIRFREEGLEWPNKIVKLPKLWHFMRCGTN